MTFQNDISSLLRQARSKIKLKCPLVFKRSYNKKKSSASSSRWINRSHQDYYIREAQSQNYRSRAAFKLIQLDDKFKLFKGGQNVLDLGYAPGAWTQVAVSKTQPEGIILGLDILPNSPPPGSSALKANIFSGVTPDMIRQFFHSPLNSGVPGILSTPMIKGDSDPLQSKEQEHNSKIHSQVENVELQPDNASIVQSSGDRKSMQRYPLDNVLSDLMANTSGIPSRDHLLSMNLCEAALVLAIELLKPDGNFVCKFFTGTEDNDLEKRIRKVFHKVHRVKPKATRSESREMYFVGLKRKKEVKLNNVFG